MPSRKIKQVDGIGRKELSSAVEEFLRHCKLKNLAKATMAYYTEDLTYFQRCVSVDRMSDVETVPEIRLGKEEFDKLDLAQYQKYTFNMYGGEVEKVTLAFTNDMMGTVMDRFGHDVMVYPIDGWHFQTTVSVAISPQFFAWVFGLGKKARIVAPEHVREEMKAMLQGVSEKYE